MSEIITLTLNPALDRTPVLEKEFFAAGKLNRIVSSRYTIGGKGLNVSRALSLFGVSSRAFAFCGGESGEKMKSILSEEMADKTPFELCLTRSAAPTRTNVKLMGENGEQTELNERGGPISEAEAAELTASFLSSCRGAVAVMSGSVPFGIGKDIYSRLCAEAFGAGAAGVIVDCDGEALEKAVFPAASGTVPTMIKPNEKELSLLAGEELDREGCVSYARKLWSERHISVLCTLGENGSFFVGGCGTVFADAVRVEAKSFAGAGDRYLGTFLYSLCVKDRLSISSLTPADRDRTAAAMSLAALESAKLVANEQ